MFRKVSQKYRQCTKFSGRGGGRKGLGIGDLRPRKRKPALLMLLLLEWGIKAKAPAGNVRKQLA